MKTLQRNLNRSTFVVWEMKRNVSVVCVCSAPNCCDTEQRSASQPASSVASGTHGILGQAVIFWFSLHDFLQALSRVYRQYKKIGHNIIIRTNTLFQDLPNYEYLLAGPFWLQKITTDPHILTDVSEWFVTKIKTRCSTFFPLRCFSYVHCY